MTHWRAATAKAVAEVVTDIVMWCDRAANYEHGRADK